MFLNYFQSENIFGGTELQLSCVYANLLILITYGEF